VGGRGSGRRPSYAGKDTTEDSLPLDIRRLQRAGALSPGRTCSWRWTVNDHVRASIQIRADVWQVVLTYAYTAHQQPAERIRQTVMLETTPCTLGGRRWWFRCPTCARRVAVIYGAGRLFACRQCKQLAYGSQSENADDRASRRADRLRKQLGWEPGILNGPGGRPKGMHLQIYARLSAEHDALVEVMLHGMAKRLGMLNGRLSEIRRQINGEP